MGKCDIIFDKSFFIYKYFNYLLLCLVLPGPRVLHPSLQRGDHYRHPGDQARDAKVSTEVKYLKGTASRSVLCFLYHKVTGLNNRRVWFFTSNLLLAESRSRYGESGVAIRNFINLSSIYRTLNS
jgi:hypothetical protein